jgi:GT2 family glycosyltransferase
MISVLVRTHNRHLLLKKCLASLDRQSFTGEYEIVVIDSASTDATSLTVKEFSDSNPRIKYLYEPVAGAARARRAGLKVAVGEILVWIDDDCSAQETWLEKMVEVFSKNTHVDVVGGQVILEWETHRPTWLPDVLDATLGKQYLGDTLIQVPTVNGANIAYRVSIAQRVTFDMSALGPYGGSKKRMSEDSEFCRQARLLGARIYFSPDAIVYHFVPKQHSTLNYLLGRYHVLGISRAVRYQLIYPEDKIDCIKRIVKGLLTLLKSLVGFIVMMPIRLLTCPKSMLVDSVFVIQSYAYLCEELSYLLSITLAQ